eukprot:108670-Amphidinium_carterae.1
MAISTGQLNLTFGEMTDSRFAVGPLWGISLNARGDLPPDTATWLRECGSHTDRLAIDAAATF